MRSLAFLTVALITVAGAAQAQSSSAGYPPGSTMPSTQRPSAQMPAPMPNQAQMSGGMGACGHTPTIRDEYGFRYDTEGNRLNARGCVIAPPVTPPGAAAR